MYIYKSILFLILSVNILQAQTIVIKTSVILSNSIYRFNGKVLFTTIRKDPKAIVVRNIIINCRTEYYFVITEGVTTPKYHTVTDNKGGLKLATRDSEEYLMLKYLCFQYERPNLYLAL